MQYIRRISVSRSHLILAAMVVAAAGLGLATLVTVERAVEEPRVTGRPVQVPDEGFVSSQTCRACHPSQYQSWHRSYHRTMTQVASPETVAASFAGVEVDAASGVSCGPSSTTPTTAAGVRQVSDPQTARAGVRQVSDPVA
jgi:hypothetical protein